MMIMIMIMIMISELIAPRTSGGLLLAPGCVVGDYRGPGASCRMFEFAELSELSELIEFTELTEFTGRARLRRFPAQAHLPTPCALVLS